MGRAVAMIAVLLLWTPAAAQTAPPTICGLPVPVPAAPPPADSRPAIVSLLLCFARQGGTSVIEPTTYLYYIQLKPSLPSQGIWTFLDDDTEATARADFRRLWDTGFLDDLTIETVDYPLANGAQGVVIVYHMEERQRVKLVDYTGLEAVGRSAIDDRLRDKSISLRLDSFIDPSLLRKVAGEVRGLLAEKGHPYATVTPSVSAIEGNAKLAQVVFAVSEGPRVAIRDVEFVGNHAFSDDELTAVLKRTRPHGLWSLLGRSGTFDEAGFAEDAQRLTEHYRDRGYIQALIGTPSLRELGDSADGTTRWVQVRVPLDEGDVFNVGTLTVEGNTVLPGDPLLSLFGTRPGDRYNQAALRKGLDRAREVYGAAGYFEFTAYPDLKPDEASKTVDVTLRVTEGKPYTVNRIEFVGNTLTQDNVIRRELAIIEGSVFNTEALKGSLRRINQLGYFKALDESALTVDRAEGHDDRVDVRIRVEEQNRNQLTFGAGASQYEGLFVNGSFSTANFLGRGESLTASMQAGTRSRNYQLSFTEPYLFGRAITGGGSLFSRKVDYALGGGGIDYSEVRSGTNITGGIGWRRYTRLFTTYTYEIVDTAMTEALRSSLDSGSTAAWARDGRYIESSVMPSIVYNTVDNPFAPRRGMRLSSSYQYAGGWLGGTTDFIKPEAQAIFYLPTTRRTALGLRVQGGVVWNYGRQDLPYYQRFFLGGETQIRGTSIRSVGPRNDQGAVYGGTRFGLLNLEYYFDPLPQVRLLAFHDAGQAFGEDDRFDIRQFRTSTGVEARVTLPVLNVPFRLIYAWNRYRDADQPARTFRFAIGTTF